MKHFLLVSFIFLLFLTPSSWASGVEDAVPYNTDPELTIYPNPTVDFFIINSAQPIAQVYVYNLFGAQVKTFEGQGRSRFYVDDLPNGMYLVQFLDADRQVVSTKRLSKK